MEEKNITKISLSTFFLILAVIVIIVMGIVMYKFYNEKIIALKESADLQERVDSLTETVKDLQGKINTISNTINPSDEKTSIEYKNLTEKIYNQMQEDQYFVIQNVKQNADGSLTLKGRIYEDVELTSISSNEYNSLKSSGKINLFGEDFLLGEYEDFVPGYILKNSNGYGFYVTDKHELIDFNDSNFVKGTDNYYMITLKETVKFINNMSGEAEKVSVSSFVTNNDYDFINNGYVYDFEFNNGEVSKVTFSR